MLKCSPLLVLALVACGDNLPDPTQLHSGSRLKLAWYEYDGGARELETSWYFDQTLGERCTPMPWSDGHRYCAPAADEAVYINETCTRALGRTLVSLPPAPFFATRYKLAGASLPVRSKLFRRGQPTLPPAAVWQKGANGCISVEQGEDFEYFELGAEVPVTELVRLRRGDPRGTGELAIIDEIGDDELRVPVALYDRAAEAECTTANLPNMVSVPCTPSSTATIAYYLDPECTDLVVAVPSDTSPSIAQLHDVPTSCSTYYRTGLELIPQPMQPMFEKSGTTCALTARPSGTRFFALGERVHVPALGRVREPGAQRIRPIARVNAELQLQDPLMYDAELDTECMHDGELQCVPRTLGRAVPETANAHYADPQCEVPIGLAFVPRGACDPPQRFASDGADYYELREPYTKPIYVPSTGDTCSGFAPPAPYVAYQIGERVERSAFARAQLVIDP